MTRLITAAAWSLLLSGACSAVPENAPEVVTEAVGTGPRLTDGGTYTGSWQD